VDAAVHPPHAEPFGGRQVLGKIKEEGDAQASAGGHLRKGLPTVKRPERARNG